LRRIKQCLGVLALMALAAGSVSIGPASAATQGSGRTKAQWQAAIAHVREPGTGCYHASYPALQWHAVKCTVAPKWPDAPALPSGSARRAVPATVGGGNGADYSAVVSGLISQATGSFQDVSPGITETGQVNNQGSQVPNAFSLQLNSEPFLSPPACSGSLNPSICQGWQQFLYDYKNGTGNVYMQYWLVSYDAVCPSNWTPTVLAPGDCYRNSKSTPVTPLTAGELATVQLSGRAASGGDDGVLLSVGSGQAVLVTYSDSVLGLAAVWNTTEWGVYGDGGGGVANFGAGTTLEAQTAITTTSSQAPACSNQGFTGETNNLSLTSTPALGSEPLPTMASMQTNGTTGTPSCAQAPASGGLNTGGNAQIKSLSCGSAGNCSAGGYYYDSSGNRQVFVVTQASGTWGTAKQVRGSAALNTGGAAGINSMSCPRSGNCSAGGYYRDSSGHQQAFLVSRSGGTFGTAKEVPNTAQLNTGGAAAINSVSCAPAGGCSAGGSYTDSSGQQAFVVSQANGTYGQAQEVPTAAPLNALSAEIDSMSCASAGNCTAGGQYVDSSGRFQVFVVSEANGNWGQAEQVPNTGNLNAGGSAGFTSVSCASAGNCSAGGLYTDGSGHLQAFVVSQAGGNWGQAEEVPNTATLNTGGNARIESVSCASAGNCSAGGYYTASSGQQAFVVSQAGGNWGQAKEVPGTATLNKGHNAATDSVSCASAGNCSAGGYYTASGLQAFVVSQAGGNWGQAKELPGTAALNTGGSAAIDSVSCASAGNCSAGGTYADSSGHYQALVDSQTGGTWSQAEEVPGTNP
jgi:hypothetical protein